MITNSNNRNNTIARHYLTGYCWHLLVLFSLLLTACGVERPEEAELLLLYTSDVMNYTLPYDLLRDKPSDVSLANFATCVKEHRAAFGDNCIVLDNGNKILGTVPAGYFNFIDTVSEPLAFRAERLIGYDAVGLGDKDLDVPVLMDQKRWKQKNQPMVLCANLIDNQTGDPVFQPYEIFERQGIRVAVLGLMSPNLLPWIPQEDRHDVDVEDMIECAAKWMPVIQQQNPDLVVGLFGASKRYQDYGDGIDTYKNVNGSIPAAIRVPGFDVILMGGSTDKEVFEVRNDAGQTVKCIQVGTTCTHCGKVKVSLRRNADDTYEKQVETAIIDLKEYMPDPDYSRQLTGVQDTLREWLNMPMGILADTLFGAKGFYGPDAYRQLVHSAQLWFSGADISLASCLIGTDTILPCVITPRTLFRIFPFANAIELIEMQGQDIIRILEYASKLQFETMRSSADPVLALKRDHQGNVMCNEEGVPYLAERPHHYLSAAGIRYTIDLTKPEGQRIKVLSMADGSAFDPRRTYEVVINSYIGKDGGSFFSKGLGWDRATIQLHAVPRSQFSIRLVLQEYILAMAGEPIRLNPRNNQWNLIPESVVAPALIREKRSARPLW